MRVRFLLDENESPRLKLATLRYNPTMDIVRVGKPSEPPLGTPDRDLLRYLEMSERAIVTSNRASMPGHITAHLSTDGHLWGFFWVRPDASIGRIARDLYLVWEVSEAEVWLDQFNWIPF